MLDSSKVLVHLNKCLSEIFLIKQTQIEQNFLKSIGLSNLYFQPVHIRHQMMFAIIIKQG